MHYSGMTQDNQARPEVAPNVRQLTNEVTNLCNRGFYGDVVVGIRAGEVKTLTVTEKIKLG